MGIFKVVEKVEVSMVYGHKGIRAIVTSEKTGLLLITSDFGGIDTLEGVGVRFKHGLAIKLKESDTLDNLDVDQWNDHMNWMSALYHGLDISRPILSYDGLLVEKIAKSAGLTC